MQLYHSKVGLLPRQLLLKDLIENSNYSWIGYGGARGGAKSGGIRRLAIYYGLNYNTKSLIFRKYSQELLDNHIYKMYEEFPFTRDFFNKSEKILLHPITRLPIVTFRYAENRQDLEKQQGPEYDYIFIDEATQITKEMIEFLKTSNRSQNPFVRKAKLILTMNPGGAGHQFIKRIFIQRQYEGNEKPNDYSFIQSRVWDNVFWLMNLINMGKLTIPGYYSLTEEEQITLMLRYSDYAQNLQGLPENLKRAYLFGDWDIIEAQFFEKFRRDIHCIEPFEIPSDWYVWGGLDYGNTTCAEIIAHDRNNDIYYVIGEWSAYKMTGPDKARSYRKFLNDIGHPNILTIADTNMFATQHELESKKSPADIFKEHDIKLLPVIKKSKDNKKFRVFCNEYVKDLLNWKQSNEGLWIEKPRIYFFEGRVKKVIETLPLLQQDTNNLEDFTMDQDIDHHYDALKYALISRDRRITESDYEEQEEDNREATRDVA